MVLRTSNDRIENLEQITEAINSGTENIKEQYMNNSEQHLEQITEVINSGTENIKESLEQIRGH